MIYAADQKIVKITPPAAIVDNAAFTTATIDTKGFAHCLIVLFFGALDVAPTVLKVQESDDSGMSGAADISGTVGGTDFTLPDDTVDDTFFAFDINLKGDRKRYLDCLVTGGNGTNGTYLSAFAILSRASESPNSASERGFGTVVSV